MPSELLKNLMFRADKKLLVLPMFQRDFVWKTPDVVKLISSLLNGYPIGGLLFMESPGEYGYRPLDGVPDPPEGSSPNPADVVLVLDGQQRLTSCYRAFFPAETASKYPGRFYFNYGSFVEKTMKSVTVEGSQVEEFIEFRPIRKILGDTAKEIAADLFPLDIIFGNPRGTDYSKWLSDYTFSRAKGNKEQHERFSQIQSDFIRRFVERITSYLVHFEEIKRDTSPDVICTVFEAINTTGKRLTVFDLLVARCYPKGIKLRDMLEKALDRPLIHSFDPEGEDLCATALPRIVSLLATGACRRVDMLGLDPSKIKDHWDSAVDALEKALSILRKEFGCLGMRFVPLVDMVAPMAVVVASPIFREDTPTIHKLSRWYWRCVFSQYFVSSTETKVARAAREWLGKKDGDGEESGYLENDEAEPEAVREFAYHDSLLDGVSRIDSAVYRGVMTMLIASGACDWGPGRRVLRDAASQELEDHHIFPKGFLTPYGIKGEPANDIINRTPLLESTNIAIRNSAPHVYTSDSKIVGKGGLPDEILRGHCVPPAVVKKNFSEAVYKEFRRDRRQALLSHVEHLVGSKPVSEEE